MEQLSELSMHLYKLLVNGVELIKNQSSVCASILQVLTLVLKISQKRKIYQPHFTISEEGLFKLHEAVEICSKTRCNPIMGLGLKAVLMSTPPVTILHLVTLLLCGFFSWFFIFILFLHLFISCSSPDFLNDYSMHSVCNCCLLYFSSLFALLYAILEQNPVLPYNDSFYRFIHFCI